MRATERRTRRGEGGRTLPAADAARPAETGGDRSPARRRRLGLRSLFNPLWCYHGMRMVIVVLTCFGVIMVYSSSAATMAAKGVSPFHQMASQGLYCAIGLAVGLACALVPVTAWRRGGFVLVVAAIILQLLTFTPLGYGTSGNNGWIRIGSQTFQPAEVMKFALCLWMPAAMINAHRRLKRQGALRAYGVPAGIYALCLVLVLGGKDLGTAMILVAIGVVAFLIGGFPARWLAVLVAFLAAAVVGMIAISPNRRARILAAYTACSAQDAQSICYQSTHARYAMASGGLLGVGLGNSREKWDYLPAAHNDFIFAIIGEETGFLGAAAVIVLFAILAWCMIWLALQISDRYVSMALICLTVWLVGQALVNIGVVVGLFPVFGVPMPFVSAGGSSLVMCLAAGGAAIGMVRLQPQIRADISRV